MDKFKSFFDYIFNMFSSHFPTFLLKCLVIGHTCFILKKIHRQTSIRRRANKPKFFKLRCIDFEIDGDFYSKTLGIYIQIS